MHVHCSQDAVEGSSAGFTLRSKCSKTSVDKDKVEFVFCCKITENKTVFNVKGGKEGTVSTIMHLCVLSFLEEGP